MTNLLKSDYIKLFKDKLFLVVCILAIVFAVITPALYGLIFAFMGESMDPVTEELLMGSVNAKGQFFGSFSFGNNLGLIAPLLIGIIIYKDFSFGTVRNKIISGHSRISIFLSNLIVCFTTLFGIILFSAFLTLFISLLLFEYQATPFAMSDFFYFLESLFFELCIYVFAAAFVCWLCVCMKNIGLVIVMYVAVIIGFIMIAAFLMAIISVLSLDPKFETTVNVLNFFQRINVFNSSASIGLGTNYEAKDWLYYVLTPLIFAAGLIGHGALKFRRKDLK